MKQEMNAMLTPMIDIFYLLSTDQWIADLKKSSAVRLFFQGVIALLMGCAFYFGWVFAPAKPVSQKTSTLIVNDFGLVALFPIAWSCAHIFAIAGMAFMFASIGKISNSIQGRK